MYTGIRLTIHRPFFANVLFPLSGLTLRLIWYNVFFIAAPPWLAVSATSFNLPLLYLELLKRPFSFLPFFFSLSPICSFPGLRPTWLGFRDVTRLLAFAVLAYLERAERFLKRCEQPQTKQLL